MLSILILCDNRTVHKFHVVIGISQIAIVCKRSVVIVLCSPEAWYRTFFQNHFAVNRVIWKDTGCLVHFQWVGFSLFCNTFNAQCIAVVLCFGKFSHCIVIQRLFLLVFRCKVKLLMCHYIVVFGKCCIPVRFYLVLHGELQHISITGLRLYFRQFDRDHFFPKGFSVHTRCI